MISQAVTCSVAVAMQGGVQNYLEISVPSCGSLQQNQDPIKASTSLATEEFYNCFKTGLQGLLE